MNQSIKNIIRSITVIIIAIFVLVFYAKLTEYLFKVEAFDPYDMFRGNYLNIDFKENSVYVNLLDEYNIYREECYVTIGIGPDGFAYFNSLSLTEPKNTSNYFKTTGYYRSYAKEYIIDTPTRYYMNENKSLNAEQTYRDNIDNTYVKVRVKNGYSWSIC